MKTIGNVLLTRDEFRESTFKRDSNKCVVCGCIAIDVHHIIDRKQFTDGGYYLNNGVSLCEKHHIEAENGILSCETLRIKASITNIILPDGFDEDLSYDKWGEVIMENNKMKYPRTRHVEWSEGATSDDKITYDLSYFIGKEIVITEKMDGENSTLMNDSCFARSLDSNNHPSRNWLKGLWGNIRYDIPQNWRICGENLYAQHSLHYDNLPSYFMVFNIWNDRNYALSWDDTVEWCKLLDLKTVTVLYRGIFDLDFIKKFTINPEFQEGYVIRLAESFSYKDFGKSVVKWVRKNHVNPNSKHWVTQKMIKNNLYEK